jgi:cytochrome P450
MSRAYDALASEIQEDPYPYYRDFLSSCPVHHQVLDVVDSERMSGNPMVARPTSDFYQIFGYEDVRNVLLQHETFSSAQGSGPERAVAPNGVGMLIYADPPHHTAQRRILNKALSPRRMARLEPRVQELASDLIDTFIADGTTDIVASFTDAIPGTFFGELLGVPAADRATFTEWAGLMLGAFGADPETQARSFKAMEELAAYFTAIFEERRRQLGAGQEPPDDLLTALITADCDGRRMDNNELFLALHVTIIGGNETVSSTLSNAVYLLAKHPDQRDLLLREPALIPSAVEEVLRYATTPQCLFRTANEDVTISGVDIPADAKIGVTFAAANRDPAAFDRPDEFDLTRTPKDLRRHVSFGYGVHACPGAPIARIEMKVALATLLARIPGFRLDEQNPPVRSNSLIRYGFGQLPIYWTVSDTAVGTGATGGMSGAGQALDR